MLEDKPEKSTVKLYVSCINECPIEGKIDNNVIIEKIQKYQKLKPDILCLSDTCGTLTAEDLNYIISNLNNKHFNNLSLHLHVKPGREDEVEQIIHRAVDFGITSFDVSALKSGGCSVTMKETELAPNLSYELYYKSLATYLLKDS
jgi:pyruvate/oxaloacetate carboxyltransferase